MNRTYNFLRQNIYIIILIVLFGIIYSLISIPNHYCFRTKALDFGMLNNALYDFAHFKNNYFGLSFERPELVFFGDHFSPIMILFAPFSYLFGSYTLLIFQILVILFAGIGLLKYSKLKTNNKWIPVIILVQFYSCWGIFSALSVDYHNNVFGAMLLPWFFYLYERDKHKSLLIILILILMSKENLALWMIFVIFGLHVKDNFHRLKQKPIFHTSLFLGTTLYFFIVTTIVMPALNPDTKVHSLSIYSHLGDSITDIIINIFKNPIKTFSILFENTINDAAYDGNKAETYFMILVSGGLAFFYRPAYFIMIIPIIFQKMLSSHFILWGINNHYSIELIPIISFALFDWIIIMKNKRRFVFLIFFTLTTIYFSFYTIEQRISKWYNPISLRFYSKAHYISPVNIREVNKILKIIPKDAIVCGNSTIIPHLSLRDIVYHFPFVRDANYIVVFKENMGTYPLSEDQFSQELQKYIDSNQWNIIRDEYNVLILKKGI